MDPWEGWRFLYTTYLVAQNCAPRFHLPAVRAIANQNILLRTEIPQEEKQTNRKTNGLRRAKLRRRQANRAKAASTALIANKFNVTQQTKTATFPGIELSKLPHS